MQNPLLLAPLSGRVLNGVVVNTTSSDQVARLIGAQTDLFDAFRLQVESIAANGNGNNVIGQGTVINNAVNTVYGTHLTAFSATTYFSPTNSVEKAALSTVNARLIVSLTSILAL